MILIYRQTYKQALSRVEKEKKENRGQIDRQTETINQAEKEKKICTDRQKLKKG